MPCNHEAINSAVYCFSTAIRTSISDDWSSTGFMEAAAELAENNPEREAMMAKKAKERIKEQKRVEKEKENEDGKLLDCANKTTLTYLLQNRQCGWKN